jgi:HYDIN/CFA65/VesB-like, Ig-like domain
LQFATQRVGTSSSPQTATLTNTGNQAVTISSIAITGEFTETNNCPGSLGVGGGCQIQVVFQPTVGGTASGKLTVNDNAQNNAQTVNLSGVGTAIVFSPEGVNFGNQKVGTKSASVPITMTNIGQTAASINGITITGSNPGDFTETNNCGNSLPGNSSCTISVTFGPTTAGARSGVISVSIGGGGSPTGVPLNGTGT